MADTRPVVDCEERGRTDRARASCRENPALIVSGAGVAATQGSDEHAVPPDGAPRPSERPAAHKIT